jgi:hypothetical protein
MMFKKSACKPQGSKRVLRPTPLLAPNSQSPCPWRRMLRLAQVFAFGACPLTLGQTLMPLYASRLKTAHLVL